MLIANIEKSTILFIILLGFGMALSAQTSENAKQQESKKPEIGKEKLSTADKNTQIEKYESGQGLDINRQKIQNDKSSSENKDIKEDTPALMIKREKKKDDN